MSKILLRQALQGDVTFEQVGEFLGEHTADEEMKIEVGNIVLQQYSIIRAPCSLISECDPVSRLNVRR